MNENLNKAAEILAGVVKHIIGSLKDGKFTWDEIVGLLPQLMRAPEVVENKELLASEWNGRDKASILDLATKIKGHVVFEDAAKTEKAHAIIDMAASGVNLLDAFKSQPALPEPVVAPV